ncbi:hypothetical protein BC827DRAFT_165675 [Russula dissimulans]|nr:hypothetical protein BC827DRAFT_165675 [Russula dissimulans]
MQAQITKRSRVRLDCPIRVGTPSYRNRGSETTVTKPTPSQDKGKGRTTDLNPCIDTHTTDGTVRPGLGGKGKSHLQANACTASKEPLYDAPSRSSVEVERILLWARIRTNQLRSFFGRLEREVQMMIKSRTALHIIAHYHLRVIAILCRHGKELACNHSYSTWVSVTRS